VITRAEERRTQPTLCQAPSVLRHRVLWPRYIDAEPPPAGCNPYLTKRNPSPPRSRSAHRSTNRPHSRPRQRRKFFWAEADTRQLLEQLPPPPAPANRDTATSSRGNGFSTRQTFPDSRPSKISSTISRCRRPDQKIFLHVLAGHRFTAACRDPPANWAPPLTRRWPRSSRDLSPRRLRPGPNSADQPWIGLDRPRGASWKEFVPGVDQPPCHKVRRMSAPSHSAAARNVWERLSPKHPHQSRAISTAV